MKGAKRVSAKFASPPSLYTPKEYVLSSKMGGGGGRAGEVSERRL